MAHQPGYFPTLDGVRRVRLSEWAREQGIARITAYRMLKRGLLPVPSDRSPTGRWYVLLPSTRSGRTAFYTRAMPGKSQIAVINRQVAALSRWAAAHERPVHTVVREIADPFTGGALPRLEKLLFDSHVTSIVIHSPAVVGDFAFRLLSAALAPQGRMISALHQSEPEEEHDPADPRFAANENRGRAAIP